MHRGGIAQKKIAFVGDLRRGRTVRSLAALLTQFEEVKLYFVAPPEYQIGQDILSLLDQQKTAYEITDDFEKVIPEVDAIYMTRLQDEWDQEEGAHVDIDIERFSFQKRHLELLLSLIHILITPVMVRQLPPSRTVTFSGSCRESDCSARR